MNNKDLDSRSETSIPKRVDNSESKNQNNDKKVFVVKDKQSKKNMSNPKVVKKPETEEFQSNEQYLLEDQETIKVIDPNKIFISVPEIEDNEQNDNEPSNKTTSNLDDEKQKESKKMNNQSKNYQGKNNSNFKSRKEYEVKVVEGTSTLLPAEIKQGLSTEDFHNLSKEDKKLASKIYSKKSKWAKKNKTKTFFLVIIFLLFALSVLGAFGLKLISDYMDNQKIGWDFLGTITLNEMNFSNLETFELLNNISNILFIIAIPFFGLLLITYLTFHFISFTRNTIKRVEYEILMNDQNAKNINVLASTVKRRSYGVDNSKRQRKPINRNKRQYD